jgi:hypothetical protein
MHGENHMKNTNIAALAAILCIGASAAAIAQPWNNGPGRGNGPSRWDNIGTVTIDGRMGPGPGRRGPGGPGPGGMDRESRSFDLGGPVERLQLRADRSDINCRSVMARFGNGRSNQVYQGMLRQGRTVDVNLPGTARDLNGLTFACTSMNGRDATISISADVGRYRQDWMRGPNWRGTWARMFNWGSETVNKWQQVGRESFEGRGDVEMTNVSLRGRHVDAIALMPVNADARCSGATARFDNGRSQALNLRNATTLRRGVYTQVDVPGNYRNLESISLRCSAVNARSVTINLYTSH